jgi:hypothetical protein
MILLIKGRIHSGLNINMHIHLADILAIIKAIRLYATICRVRFVFRHIKMSAGAIIHCRFVKKKFKFSQLMRV